MPRPLENSVVSGASQSIDRFVDLLSNFGGIFNLRNKSFVVFVLQPDHQGFVSATMHGVEPNPRHLDTWYSPSPPYLLLYLRICFRAYHVL